VVVLALDVVWPRLRAQRPQQVVGLAVVGFALLGLDRANSSNAVGEAHADGMLPEISAALACDSGQTLYVEGQVFHPLCAAAYAQGIAFRATLTERDGLPVEIPYGTG
jgi:hypothetical protein